MLDQAAVGIVGRRVLAARLDPRLQIPQGLGQRLALEVALTHAQRVGQDRPKLGRDVRLPGVAASVGDHLVAAAEQVRHAHGSDPASRATTPLRVRDGHDRGVSRRGDRAGL